MLAEHLHDDNTADSGDPQGQPIRSAGNPREEFLSALAAVKRDVDEVIANFPMELPTRNAALQHSRKMRALYDTIEIREQKESPSISADLSALRNYALGASIAVLRLTGDDLPIDTMTDAFEHVKKFKDKLQAVLNIYNSPNS